jgi:multicomponent Na+:H+ antiporter subunit G
MTPISILASMLLLLGALFCLVGALGVWRLPDSYTRMHAASKAGALGSAFILGGLLLASDPQTALVCLMALVILMILSPLTAHVVARSAYRSLDMPTLGPLGDALQKEEAQRANSPLRESPTIPPVQ